MLKKTRVLDESFEKSLSFFFSNQTLKHGIRMHRDGGTGKAPRHVPYLKSEA